MYQPMFPSLTGNTGQKGALTLGASKRPNGRKANSIIRKRTKDVPYDHAGKFPKENVENNEVGQQSQQMTSVRAGLQRAYLDGLDFLRNKIQDSEQEVQSLQQSFYSSEEAKGDNLTQKQIDYLKQVNDKLLNANNELKRKNIKLEIIDSETRLVGLINKLREAMEYDKGEITMITEFWENLKNTVDGFRALVEKFQNSVLNRLNQSCISYSSDDINLEVSNRYTLDISDYITELERELTNTRLLLKSLDSGLHQDLFKDSEFSEKLLVACDLKAFPILRLIPDLENKISNLCDISRKWLNRDEEYMYEVNDYIRKTRTITKRRSDVLKNQKEKQKKIEKSVKSTQILLQNNREKLHTIESELNQLDEQIAGYEHVKKSKHEEKEQKANMADFLKLTLTQTKKNYSLQIKRQKLLKQVRELEQLLIAIERELSDVQDKKVERDQAKSLLTEKVENSQKSYGAARNEFSKYSDELETLEQEVNILSGQLLQLEIIQTYKTSPENMEQIFDRPQTVKLAPSLREKIKNRKRKVGTQKVD
ncbi:putative leucine-rich repeat-containing protein DDB_G0290503 isoform X1 [Mytilus edulis]|uniref:putative leucine-rich repeat-containing protein DDB_G0290503 isoform X1 n=1 Tax=Mytilus edulis TaxID=6550 RepID=UPI0039EF0D27